MERDKKEQETKELQSWQFSLILSLSQSLWYHWLWGVTGSLALLHMSAQALQINEWPPELLTLPWAARDVQTLWQPIYNHIKTPQRPWLCVVASWIQASWMFSVLERGNVATGHRIMKKCLAAKSGRNLCNGDAAACLFLHLCVYVCGRCVCVCAQQHCESGLTDVGSDGELDVWECKVQWERRGSSSGGKGRSLGPSPHSPPLLQFTHMHSKIFQIIFILHIL